MGAWGHQFDENDSALDWFGDFDSAPSWGIVEAALQSAMASAYEYLEVDEGSAALAAAEVVAAGLGKASPRLPDNAMAWVKRNSDGATPLTEIAREAAIAVRDGGELHELWHEGGEPTEWLATVDDLLSRLS
jgi:hypothetical protein